MSNTSFRMIKSGFRAIDIYGSNMALTHDGRSKFKTCFGGVMSLASILLMGVCLYAILSQPTTKIASTVTSSSLGKDTLVIDSLF